MRAWGDTSIGNGLSGGHNGSRIGKSGKGGYMEDRSKQITSPLSKSKQEVFSQTGKLNLPADGNDMTYDEGSLMSNSMKSQTL